MKRFRPTPSMAIAFAALAIAIGGVAIAAIPDSEGVIHGCYGNTNGNLRVVESDSNCRRNETAIEWNQRGPAGGGEVVARMRGGPVAALEPGERVVPLSKSSWTQAPSEFQELQVAFEADVLCELRVAVFLDGKLLDGFFFLRSGADRDSDFFDYPIFETGSEVTHMLEARIAPTSFCGETVRGGTLTSFKANVLSFR